ADHGALDDEQAIALGRSIVQPLGRKAPAPPWDRREPEPPAVSSTGGEGAAHLYAAISAETRRPVPVREIIARLVDGSRLHEFKPPYGDTVARGFSHLYRCPVGILPNDG